MRAALLVVALVVMAMFVRHDVQTSKAACLKDGGRWVHISKSYECRKW